MCALGFPQGGGEVIECNSGWEGSWTAESKEAACRSTERAEGTSGDKTRPCWSSSRWCCQIIGGTGELLPSLYMSFAKTCIAFCAIVYLQYSVHFLKVTLQF